MNAIRDIFVGKSNQEAILNAKRIRFFNELREICAQIKCTDMWFEMEEDEGLRRVVWRDWSVVPAHSIYSGARK